MDAILSPTRRVPCAACGEVREVREIVDELPKHPIQLVDKLGTYALAALFSEAWQRVQNKTTVEWAQVERASTLGPELLVALGIRNQPGVPEPRASDPMIRRARAFTLLVKAYDACRRGVSYLRWEEKDVDAIAPSLFAARGGGRKGGAREDEEEEEALTGEGGEPAAS